MNLSGGRILLGLLGSFALAACVDPPGDGFVVLELNRSALVGLDDVVMDVYRVDALYGEVEPPTGKLGAVSGPGKSWRVWIRS